MLKKPEANLSESTRIGARTHYSVALIWLTFFFNYGDRQLFGALLEPIKKEFQLSDLMLGLMSGLGFAVFYSLCALPLARLADRWNRKYVLAICLTFWSGACIASGAVTSAVQMLFARMFIGVGEAGGQPSGVSLISALYPRHRRNFAIGVYNAMGMVGAATAVFGGAWIAEHHGWRAAFFAFGAPGVVLGLLIALTVREPSTRAKAGETEYSFGSAIKHIVSQRGIVLTCLAGASGSGAIACQTWLVPFFQRTHGFTLAEAGLLIALFFAFASPPAQILGGLVADRFGRTKPGDALRVTALACIVSAGCAAGLALASSAAWAIVAAAAWTFFGGIYATPTYGVSQSQVEPRLRATSLATMGMTINLLGYGIGPTMVGALSSWLAPVVGEHSLRYGLLIMISSLSVLAAVLYLLAARHVRPEGNVEAGLVPSAAH